MSFLRQKDYYSLIQSADLSVVITADPTFLTEMEAATIAEISSYIGHRFDIRQIFKSIKTYNDATTFYIGDLVEWTESAYVPATYYVIGNRCSYNGYIYICISSTTGTFTPAKWTQLSANESLYYCRQKSLGSIPSNTFSYSAQNYVGQLDLVTGWDRATITLYFKKLSDNTIYIYSDSGYNTQIGQAKYPDIAINQPVLVDVFAVNDGELGGEMSIINFIPDNTTWSVSCSNNWTAGDNRHPLIKKIAIDINLFHLHSRINPRNIPDLRQKNYDNAISWLKMIQRGDSIVIDLPIYDTKPDLGQIITYGSNDKLEYGY